MTPEELAARRRAMTRHLVEALLALFTRPGSWRDGDAAAFIAEAVPMVQGTQQAMADLVAAYTAQQATAAVGRAIAPPAIPVRAIRGLRGVDPRRVYRRPFVELYTALSHGEPLSRSVEVAASRLEQIVEADLQQTYAHASREAMRRLPAGARATAWRRVLEGPKSCALCIVASTQRYHVEALNPIHPGCDCTVEPLYGPDPGQVIEPDLLERVHAAVEQLTGRSSRGGREPDYRKLIVRMTPEHGELGPMLVRPLDHFTDEADLG